MLYYWCLGYKWASLEYFALGTPHCALCAGASQQQIAEDEPADTGSAVASSSSVIILREAKVIVLARVCVWVSVCLSIYKQNHSRTIETLCMKLSIGNQNTQGWN